jgi:predicted nucleic acid-binding protein
MLAQEIYENSTEYLVLDFLHIEVSNAFASAIRQRRITAALATKAQIELAELLPITASASQYLTAAFALALQINHPVYDCLYAVAARENSATLVTCDAKFAAKLDTAIYSVKLV